MARFRDSKKKDMNMFERGILQRIIRSPLLDKEPARSKQELKERFLKFFSDELDKRLETMTCGQGLGVVFRFEVLLSERDSYWSLKVKERDNYVCVECGNDLFLEAHHIKGIVENPELIDDIENGITLCLDCHAKKHPDQKKLILAKKKFLMKKTKSGEISG